MESLRLQLERLRTVLESVDVDAAVRVVPAPELAAVQATLAHAEALVRRLPAHGASRSSALSPRIDTLATVAAQTGMSIADILACNPALSRLSEDAPLPANTFLKLRAPPASLAAAATIVAARDPNDAVRSRESSEPTGGSRRPSGRGSDGSGGQPRASGSRLQELSLSPPPPPPRTAASPPREGATTTVHSAAPRSSSATDTSPDRPASRPGASTEGESIVYTVTNESAHSPSQRPSPDHFAYDSIDPIAYRGASWAPESPSANMSTVSAPPPCAPMPGVPSGRAASHEEEEHTWQRDVVGWTSPPQPSHPQAPPRIAPEGGAPGGAVSRAEDRRPASPHTPTGKEQTPPRKVSPVDAFVMANSPPSPIPQPPVGQGTHRQHGAAAGAGKKVGSPPLSRRPKTSKPKTPPPPPPPLGHPASGNGDNMRTAVREEPQLQEAPWRAAPTAANAERRHASTVTEEDGLARQAPDAHHRTGGPAGSGALSTSPTSSSPESTAGRGSSGGGLTGRGPSAGITVITTRRRSGGGSGSGSRSPASSQPRSPSQSIPRESDPRRPEGQRPQTQREQRQQLPQPLPVTGPQEPDDSVTPSNLSPYWRDETSEDFLRPTASHAPGAEEETTVASQQRSERRFDRLSVSQPRAGSASMSALSAPSTVSAGSMPRASSQMGRPNRLAPSPVEARSIFASPEEEERVAASLSVSEDRPERPSREISVTNQETQRLREREDAEHHEEEEDEDSRTRACTVSISVSKERAASADVDPANAYGGLPQVPLQGANLREASGHRRGHVSDQRALGLPDTPSSAPTNVAKAEASRAAEPENEPSEPVTAEPKEENSSSSSSSGEEEEDVAREEAPTPCSDVPSSLAGYYYANNLAPMVRNQRTEEKQPAQKRSGDVTDLRANTGGAARVPSPPPEVSMATSSTFISDPPSFQETSPAPPRQRRPTESSSVSTSGRYGRLSPSAYPLEDGSHLTASSHTSKPEEVCTPERSVGGQMDASGTGKHSGYDDDENDNDEGAAGAATASGVARTNGGGNSPPPRATPAPVLSCSPRTPSRSRMIDKQPQHLRSHSAPPGSSISREASHASFVDTAASGPRNPSDASAETAANTLHARGSGSSNSSEAGLGYMEGAADEEDEYDTIASIAAVYSVTVEEVVKWNPYLSVYAADDPLPPDLPIVLPMPGSAEHGAESEALSPDRALDAWNGEMTSPNPKCPTA